MEISPGRILLPLADDAEVAPPCGLWQTAGRVIEPSGAKPTTAMATLLVAILFSAGGSRHTNVNTHERERMDERLATRTKRRLLLSPARIFDISNSRIHLTAPPPDTARNPLLVRSFILMNSRLFGSPDLLEKPTRAEAAAFATSRLSSSPSLFETKLNFRLAKQKQKRKTPLPPSCE